MKAIAVLNNYQIGSYCHNILSQKIIKEERVDRYHTQVVWDNLTISDFNLLKRVIRNIKEV